MRCLALALLLLGSNALAAEPTKPPSEDEIFGAPEPDPTKPPDAVPSPEDKPDQPVEPTSPAEPAGEDPFADLPQGPIIIQEDPLAIGGQLFVRMLAQVNDRGSPGEQRFSMPNLLDLYLDARPEDRVRGFVSGRLYFDPTVQTGDTNQLGQTIDATRILLDQLWLKTDIEHRVFLTLGQERIKWGSSRIWNPTDFINAQKRDPLALFDERTGVPMLKVHIPIDTWNLYVIGLLGRADQLDQLGAATRLEMAFSSTEIAVSALAGAGRKTSVGVDLSTALGDFDITLEASLTDEHDTLVYEGNLDLDTGETPTSRKRDAWVGRFTAGVQYGFKVNENDAQYVGLEYFYNPLGYSDPSIYPWLILNGAYDPFYVGQHYLGVTYVVPSPGNWDHETFSLTGLANLSDKSYVTRLDFSSTIHTRLTLQAYVQGSFGHRGGELHFALDVPAVPGVLDEPINLPAPVLGVGLNLVISI